MQRWLGRNGTGQVEVAGQGKGQAKAKGQARVLARWWRVLAAAEKGRSGCTHVGAPPGTSIDALSVAQRTAQARRMTSW